MSTMNSMYISCTYLNIYLSYSFRLEILKKLNILGLVDSDEIHISDGISSRVRGCIQLDKRIRVSV